MSAKSTRRIRPPSSSRGSTKPMTRRACASPKSSKCSATARASSCCRSFSHQLRVLRGARLVKFRKEGKEAFYSLDDDHVVTLMQQGLDHVLHG